VSEGPAGVQPESDIYTVLLIIATLIVVASTVYLAVCSQSLFGTWNPFSAV